MKRQQFIEYMQFPEKLSGEDTALMLSLVKEFPYFQTAQLLYTKSLYDQKSIHYSNQLKVAAAYSSDRKVLYGLIMPKNIEILEEKTPQIEEKTPQIEKNIPALPLSKFEQEIIKEAISASIELEVSNQGSFASLTDNISLEASFTEASTNFNKEAKHSFNEWLKLTSLKSEKHTENKRARNQFSALIDKFIDEEPKISVPKTEFFSPVSMARQSVIEDGAFITETLAKIYVQQGNLSKAIKAYETLSLKYPKKRLYFAAQIKSLKKLSRPD